MLMRFIGLRHQSQVGGGPDLFAVCPCFMDGLPSVICNGRIQTLVHNVEVLLHILLVVIGLVLVIQEVLLHILRLVLRM